MNISMNIKPIALFSMIALSGLNTTFAATQTQTTTMIQQHQFNHALDQQQAHAAILKMAGEYQVNFRFEELYSTKSGYENKKPDLSKGYEAVIVLENTPDKVVLQHLLMVGQHVVKHWRQDWQYQPKEMWTYIGNYQWKKVELSSEESKGKWLQTVWQVDDSPRYASLGEWTNDHGIEAWTSNQTDRPLPRRELTTRDDYDVVAGVNRQAITANGWVHEQDNIKYDIGSETAIAREIGVNTYVKVQGVDFKPAYQYWEKNKTYWSAVRQAWDSAFQQNEVLGLRFTRQKEDDKDAHYMHFFSQAKQFAGKKSTEKQMNLEVKQLLNKELTTGQIH